ncbi:PIN domain-containing protein [Candidatus Woesearchaeota archaeon]|nr:PIN domain-containing protein [Candidatus Woesearchaeota archaeon]
MKCLDTYILMEIAQGNNNFLSYIQEDFVITSETLAEFVWVILRDQDEMTAEYWYQKLISYSNNVDASLLVEAMKFRHKHKQQKLSFFDCVGYIYSCHNKIVFVTGDKEFRSMKNVEYIPS